MRRLFGGAFDGRLWLLTSPAAQREAAAHHPFPNAAHVRCVELARPPARVGPLLAPFYQATNLRKIVSAGVELVRAHKIELLFTAPWSPFFVAAHQLQQRTGLPLLAYVMDDWLWGEMGRRRGRRRRKGLGFSPSPTLNPRRLLGRALLRLDMAAEAHRYRTSMPLVLQHAAKVWGISEYMNDFLSYAFAVRAEPLPPLIDVEAFRRACGAAQPRPAGLVNIVFTGSIYEAQRDALYNLAALIRSGELARELGRPVQLTLYTGASPDALSAMGLCGEQIVASYIDAAEVPAALGAADVLFLPFSFAEGVEHLIRTSFPTKTAEYLASGVPILVHGPPYSSIARYFNQHQAGTVVTELTSGALKAGLVQLLGNPAYGQRMTDNALATALRYHDSRHILHDFHNTLSAIARRGVV